MTVNTTGAKCAKL